MSENSESAKQRFIAKPKGKAWYVYDTERACYPVLVPGFGRVAEAFKHEDEAAIEARRLEDHFR